MHYTLHMHYNTSKMLKHWNTHILVVMTSVIGYTAVCVISHVMGFDCWCHRMEVCDCQVRCLHWLHSSFFKLFLHHLSWRGRTFLSNQLRNWTRNRGKDLSFLPITCQLWLTLLSGQWKWVMLYAGNYPKSVCFVFISFVWFDFNLLSNWAQSSANVRRGFHFRLESIMNLIGRTALNTDWPLD